jgi:DNA-directed RNA polymerase specialized sigma24 family protein
VTSDTWLVERALTGDKEAFGALLERHIRTVEVVAGRLVYNPEIRKELLQEAYLEAYLSLCHLRQPARFGSWLCGIALNICRNYLRRQPSAPFSLDDLTGGTYYPGVTFANLAPDPALIAAAIATLSPRNRAATLLFTSMG